MEPILSLNIFVSSALGVYLMITIVAPIVMVLDVIASRVLRIDPLDSPQWLLIYSGVSVVGYIFVLTIVGIASLSLVPQP